MSAQPNPANDRGVAALQAALTRAQVELAQARGEIERLTAAAQAPAEWPNDKPPPHWTPDDQFDRHPKTAEAWDWRADGSGDERWDRQIRRLNFAGDRADPRAPDQMALVLRKDLIDIKHKLITALARVGLYKVQADAARSAPFCWPPGQALTVVQTDEPGHWSLDWKPDQVIFFAGWSWDVRKGRADIWVSDVWPPRHNGDLTDGWDPIDLTLAAAQASTGGEAA